MTELRNDRFLRALRREPVDVTPVWIMRQAGRYLPEYRETRAKAGSFMKLCMTPELACEVTLQPLNRFALDAAILFSDILTIPGAMGLGLEFAEGEGPRFAHPVRSAADIDRLAAPDPETELRYVMDAVRLIRRELAGRVPLIGFAGSPWTLATYAVEGASSSDFRLVKSLLYREPRQMHRLLDVLSRAVIGYLPAQIAAGAQALMIFDTWGGILTTPAFEEFSLAYMREIVGALNGGTQNHRVPVILFTRGGGGWLKQLADTGCDALSVDWTLDLGAARALVGERVALQGNLDPCALYAPAERIRQEVKRTLENFGKGNGHVFNLGHGVHPHVAPENVAAMVEAVHELSRPFHN
jgi:uroporphyrinogen decarboxylase